MARKKHLHEKLGISLGELLALLGVQAALKAGLLVRQKAPNRSWRIDPLPHHHGFTMSQPMRAGKCGTVGCIGGYMGLTAGKSIDGNPHSPDSIAYYLGRQGNAKLYDLFYPLQGCTSLRYDNITVPQVLEAIANYLKHGSAKWDKVLGYKRKVLGYKRGRRPGKFIWVKA